tara:strand:- start:22600 stop:24048 length:1449 start_codon:yes stop_codon:yes gene_type:complete
MTTASPPQRDKTGIGSTLENRYRIIQKRPLHGVYESYVAAHTLAGEKVLIELLSAQEEGGGFFQFEQEVIKRAQLQTPHILQIIEHNETPYGELYYVTEFVPGQTLEELITTQGPLHLARALSITSQIANALAVTYKAELYHHALHPKHITLVPDGSGGDFVKLHGLGVPFPQQNSYKIAPTYPYLAPEQMEDEGVEHPHTDVYQLGLLLLSMLTGQLLTQPLPPNELPSLPAYVDIPNSLHTLFHTMVENVAANRPTMQKVAKKLAIEEKKQRPGLSFLTQPLMGVGLLFVIVIGLSWFFWPQPTQPTTNTTQQSDASVAAALPEKTKTPETNTRGSSPNTNTIPDTSTKDAVSSPPERAIPPEPTERVSAAQPTKKPVKKNRRRPLKVRKKPKRVVRRRSRRLRRRRIRLSSSPTGAAVYIKGQSKRLGVTPIRIRIARDSTKVFIIKRKDHFSKTIRISPTNKKSSYFVRLKPIQIELP